MAELHLRGGDGSKASGFPVGMVHMAGTSIASFQVAFLTGGISMEEAKKGEDNTVGENTRKIKQKQRD